MKIPSYNITLGLPFPEAAIWRVCDTTQFTEVAKKLPHELASNIQEKGVNLSGGQKQRLALARGVLAAQAAILYYLMSLQVVWTPKPKHRFYDQLFEVFKNKAVLSSLHRLHLLDKFDYVYVLQEGRIVEEGTFGFLHNNGTYFKELWKHQEKANS
ncbi:MAG: ABC transporter ATP-binding protein [Spirosomataceae bacterium]